MTDHIVDANKKAAPRCGDCRWWKPWFGREPGICTNENRMKDETPKPYTGMYPTRYSMDLACGPEFTPKDPDQ